MSLRSAKLCSIYCLDKVSPFTLGEIDGRLTVVYLMKDGVKPLSYEVVFKKATELLS